MNSESAYLSAVRKLVAWQLQAEKSWVAAYRANNRDGMYAALAAFEQIVAGLDRLTPPDRYIVIHQVYTHLQACAERVAQARTSARDAERITSADAELKVARKVMREVWSRHPGLAHPAR